MRRPAKAPRFRLPGGAANPRTGNEVAEVAQHMTPSLAASSRFRETLPQRLDLADWQNDEAESNPEAEVPPAHACA